jgi:hypothetical protein
LIVTLEEFVSLFLERGESTIIVLESLLLLHLAIVLDVTTRVLPQPFLLLVLARCCLAESDVHGHSGLA